MANSTNNLHSAISRKKQTRNKQQLSCQRNALSILLQGRAKVKALPCVKGRFYIGTVCRLEARGLKKRWIQLAQCLATRQLEDGQIPTRASVRVRRL